MPWFIKTEVFSSETLTLSPKKRKLYINMHKEWVLKLKNNGINISSGFLVNSEGIPGGGGLLILQADSFQSAKAIIETDPMILAGLVSWELQEWIPVIGEPLK